MTAETIVGQADAPAPKGLTIPEDRRSVALEAAWELDALAEATFDLCRCLGEADLDQGDLMRLQLKLRGMTTRMAQLANVVNSVLDNDDTTSNLFRVVHGHLPRTEVAHG